jgi:tetraacyldisaccharide 4'-kinase
LIVQRLRGRLEGWLLRVWFGPASFSDRLLAGLLAPAALPLSWVVASTARRRRQRIVRQAPNAATVPVVVVGNLVAGGSGKTPLVVAIARGLVEAGFRPGLLARGYRAKGSLPAGDAADKLRVTMIDRNADAAAVGDEALLLALETGLPVAVGRDRRAAAELLQRCHPGCNVIISDDGLQHVGLARAIELLVIDPRGFGNGRCLPAGPLREPADRVDSVDAVVLTAGAEPAATSAAPSAARPHHPRVFRSTLEVRRFRVLDASAQWLPEQFAAQFGSESLAAIAGIAQPQRFFASLQGLGLKPRCHALPDHAELDERWLAALPGRWILMTGKDAVKCRKFSTELLARCVCLDVAAVPDPALLKWLAARLHPAAHSNG